MSSPISSSSGPTAKSPEPDRVRFAHAMYTMHRLVPGSGPGASLCRARQACVRHAAVTHLATACLRGWLPAAAVLAISMFATSRHAAADDINDYPTTARADYVFGCMKANGETQEILQKCSCSIDVIASLIPYDRYVDRRDNSLDVPGHGSGRLRISFDRTCQAGAAGIPARAGGSGSSLLLTGRLQADAATASIWRSAIRP